MGKINLNYSLHRNLSLLDLPPETPTTCLTPTFLPPVLARLHQHIDRFPLLVRNALQPTIMQLVNSIPDQVKHFVASDERRGPQVLDDNLE